MKFEIAVYVETEKSHVLSVEIFFERILENMKHQYWVENSEIQAGVKSVTVSFRTTPEKHMWWVNFLVQMIQCLELFIPVYEYLVRVKRIGDSDDDSSGSTRSS